MGISELYVEEAAADNPLVGRFAARLGLHPIVIPNPDALYSELKQTVDPWGTGKKRLLLTRNRGPFLRQCPGTRDYICCDYNILHIGTYCSMDCAYCILQSYFHPPVLQYFVNHEDLLQTVDEALRQPRILRVGTGEYTDSLIWEAWSGLTPLLVERFGGQHWSVLELKTKTVAIQQLRGLTHARKTILSWSLNTPRMITELERGTTPLHARLAAAACCQEWGYPLAFHFDPIVIYPGCEEEYRGVIQALFKQVAAENIAWISMGTLRFMPALQPIVRQRFPHAKILQGEFIPGIDGKVRYFKPLRITIYRRMVDWIRSFAPGVTLYFCMEDEPVWQHAMGFAPRSKGGLPAMLDAAAQAVCGVGERSVIIK